MSSYTQFSLFLLFLNFYYVLIFSGYFSSFLSPLPYFFLTSFFSTLFFSVFRITSLQIPILRSWVQTFPRYSWWALENFSFIRGVFAGLILFLCFIVLSFSSAEVFHGWSTWIYVWVWSALSFTTVVYIGCCWGQLLHSLLTLQSTQRRIF